MFKEQKIIAVDIGSNAIRASLAYFDNSFDLEVVQSFRFPVRLGEDVFSKGRVSKKKILEMEEAFAYLKRIAFDEKVDKIVAVATSALRNSKNGEEILQLIKDKFDVEIEIIAGKREAELIAKAVNSAIRLDDKTALLVDVGGGSTEISVIDSGEIIFCESYPIGTVRLLEFQKKKELIEIISPIITNAFEQISKIIDCSKISVFAGTGGNLKRMGKLRSVFFSRHPHKVTQQELIAINLEVSKLSIEKRVELLGMRKDRADVILPAMQIIESILIKFNAKEILLPLVGLKEGIFIDHLGKMPRSIVFN